MPYIIFSIPALIVGLFFNIKKYLAKPWMIWVWWIGSVVIVGLAGWYDIQNKAWIDFDWSDFTYGYYYGGSIILNDPTSLYPGENWVDGFVNIPLLAYLFVPFSYFPSQIAARIFYLFGYISIIPLAYWLIKISGVDGWKRWLILLALITSESLDESLDWGNTTHFIMIFVMISLWWFKQGREWLSGLLLGFNGLIKLPLILPSGYFFIRRRWRVVGGGLLAVGLALMFSFLLIPISLNLEWLDKIILSFAGHPVAAYNNQSVAGFLARQLISGSDVFSWRPIVPGTLFNIASIVLVALLYVPVIVVLFSNWKSSRTKHKYILEYFIVLVCSILTSPISWTHYYMMLLIPASIYIKEDIFDRSRLSLNLLLGTSLILLASPSGLPRTLFENTGLRLFLSSHFFGGLLFYIFLFRLWIYQNKRKTSQYLSS